MEKERIQIAFNCINLWIKNVHLHRSDQKPINGILDYGRRSKLKAAEVEEVSKMTIGEIIEIFSKK